MIIILFWKNWICKKTLVVQASVFYILDESPFFRFYTKWCWWWFFNTIFCIHKISSQCYEMKLYQCRWIYHSHLRFRLTLRINGRNSYMNPSRWKRRRCWYSTVPIWKTQEKPTGIKKLHSISEVKFSRSSTPFDKDPFFKSWKVANY